MKTPLGLIPYTGNKEKLLPEISRYFPEDTKRFIDAFCGGLSVSLFVSGVVVANDYEKRLIDAYRELQTLETPIAEIDSIIKTHNLSRENKEAYIQFRELYNKSIEKDPLWLFVLIQHSFSNVCRFNRKGEFNANFGKRTFNDNAKARVNNFKRETQGDRITFTSGRYDEIEIRDGDFVYLDPPYFITSAEYNKFWSDKEEVKFYEWVEGLHAKGIKFGLSNVTHHKDQVNHYLLDFISRNNFEVIELNKTYCLDRSGGKSSSTKEVYITNVEV